MQKDVFRYSVNDSIADIMSDPDITEMISGVFSSFLLDSVSDDMRNRPLQEVGRKVMTPWGFPFPAEGFLHSARLAKELKDQERYHFIPLWRENEKDYTPTFANDRDSVSLLELRINENELRPAAIICPGGGYEFLMSDTEGISLGKKLEESGFHSFVLTYRIAPHRYPAPQTDLALAVKYIRKNAVKFHIDPRKIMIVGSSAGGHLCASYAAEPEKYERILTEELSAALLSAVPMYDGVSPLPNMVCLCYPVISFTSEQHEGSFLNLTGGDEALRKALSVEQNVTHRYPKTFIWACKDDQEVPVSNSIRMKEALDAAGAEAELILYPSGGHGCCMAEGTSAEGWMEEMTTFFEI